MVDPTRFGELPHPPAQTPRDEEGSAEMGTSSGAAESKVTLRQASSFEEGGPRVPLEIGRARWRDLLSLTAIDQHILLDQPRRHPRQSHPVPAAIRSLLPFVPSQQHVFVARGDHRLMGYALFREASLDQRWILEAVGAAMGVYAAEPVWEELLRHGVVAAGLEGVKRLYARIPASSLVRSAARRCGFVPYANEVVYVTAGARPRTPGRRARAQRPADLWAVHQLYTAIVPRQVQYAEALTSESWGVPRGRFRGGYGCQGWLVEEGHQVVGYARVESRPDAHVMDLFVRPDRREVAGDLIETVLARLAAMPARPIYCHVRGYQMEWSHLLEDAGFDLFLSQDLHVKYTTSPSRVPAVESVVFTADVKEPSANRVPTFLQGTSGEPSSETVGG